MQSKSSSTNLSQRRHTRGTGHATQIWHNYHTFILEICQPKICTAKAKWESPNISRVEKNLTSDDYININHPDSTLTDAAQHLEGQNLFCKFDCSLAYHCLQMANQRSKETLVFNFAGRTFAYRRLAQDLSPTLSAAL